MMFKITILQRLYNISDDQTEYQINKVCAIFSLIMMNLTYALC
ncbi:transposase [Treponema sp. OMZ 798]